MYFKSAKIYTDGSHYIAIPYSTRPQKHKPATSKIEPESVSQIIDATNEKVATVDKKELFEQLYKENIKNRKKVRELNIIEGIKSCFKNDNEAAEYVAKNIERKQRNLIVRRVRLWRKLNLQQWHYFATFTYDNKKHNAGMMVVL